MANTRRAWPFCVPLAFCPFSGTLLTNCPPVLLGDDEEAGNRTEGAGFPRAGTADASLLKAHWVKMGFAGSLRHDIQFAQHFFQMAVHLDLLENIIDCALLINDEGCAFDAHELPAVERFFFPHAIGL